LTQLCFEFLPVADPPPSRPSLYRRRLRDVASKAYRLGAMRAAGKPIIPQPPRSLGAAASPPILVHLDRADRNELDVRRPDCLADDPVAGEPVCEA
jgi:hypothetical protein